MHECTISAHVTLYDVRACLTDINAFSPSLHIACCEDGTFWYSVLLGCILLPHDHTLNWSNDVSVSALFTNVIHQHGILGVKLLPHLSKFTWQYNGDKLDWVRIMCSVYRVWKQESPMHRLMCVL